MSRAVRLLALLALAAVTLLAVGCSDDSDSSASTSQKPPMSTGVAQCDDADIEAALPDGATLDTYECDEGWAAVTFTAAGTQDTLAYQAEGQFWIHMPCDAEGIPESISDQVC